MPLDGDYILTQDIDCNDSVNWNGGEGFDTISGFFLGSLDGQNHTIDGLYTNNTTSGLAGIFGSMGGVTIKNLKITDANIIAPYSGGILATFGDFTLIDNVHVSGTITSSDGSATGGLIGRFCSGGGTLSNSSADVEIVSSMHLLESGGLLGRVEGTCGGYTTLTISESYATGSITSDGVVSDIGGLVGFTDSNQGETVAISNSYAQVDIVAQGDGTNVGGLIGRQQTPESSVSNSYSTGLVSIGGTKTDVGGLIGNTSGTVSNSFWDIDTSGQATSDGGTGKTTAEMKDATTFTSAGWDFDDIWAIDADLNNGYPYLQWQTWPSPTPTPNEDLNGDGIADSLQPYVSSVTSSVTGKYTVLQTNNACIISAMNVASGESQAVKDSAYTYPDGLMSFTANCGTPGYTTTITQFFYGDTDTSYTLRKHNPNTGAYFNVPGATFAVRDIYGNKVLTATYEVTDGGSLDIDGIANGVIVDPTGPGKSVVGAPNTGLGGASDWNKQYAFPAKQDWR